MGIKYVIYKKIQGNRHIVDRKIYTIVHDYQILTIFIPICLNGHSNGHLYPPPPILAICGKQTATCSS